MKIYTYQLNENSTRSTDNLADIPEGVSYTTEEIEVVEEVIQEVPEQITALQFFTQLLIEGITEAAIVMTINSLVINEQLPEVHGELAKIALRKATVFERQNPFIDVIGFAFSKTDAQLDTIFINASKL